VAAAVTAMYLVLMRMPKTSTSGSPASESSASAGTSLKTKRGAVSMHRRDSDDKVANRDGRDFGWEIAHAAVSRRPPISLSSIVARTHMYTYAAKVWDLFLVQGPFSVAPVPNPTIRNFFIAGGLPPMS
jgi:hypothetical protein